MANPEHVKVVMKGAEAIKAWRIRNPSDNFDLSNAKLEYSNLDDADLSNSNLTGVNAIEASFIDADLRGANLSRGHFIRVNLSRSRLAGANLSDSLFSTSLFWTADLKGANLARSSLRFCEFDFADLTEADLTEAVLNGSKFVYVELSRTNLSRAQFGGTTIAGCDIRSCRNIETTIHTGPSFFAFEIVYEALVNRKALTPELVTFFTNAGVPKNLFEAFGELMVHLGERVEYANSFVCYGGADASFAEKLVRDLKALGAPAWLYRLDMTPGEKTWPEIIKARRKADRMIVICSVNSLIREGALKEIEAQIDEDADKMIPVSIDDAWKEKGFPVKRGERDLKPYLLERNHVGFVGVKYEDALGKLLSVLEKD